ncbi:MAG TPA: hypothetical protein VIO37_13320 [Candidatus Dormibacteraeota bacterium]
MSAQTPLRLRPLEIGDLLDETFRMYRRHFLLFAGLSVIFAIPTAAFSGFILYTLFNTLLRPGRPFMVDPSFLVWYGVFLLITLVLVPFQYGVVTYAACESALGRPVTASGVLNGVLRRYFPLLGYFILVSLMAVAFCLLPLWIWIWVSWCVVLPVMFIENVGLLPAMGRSWRLVEGRWWRTFLVLFLVLVVFYVATLALRAFIALGQALLQLVVSQMVVLWISGATTAIVDSLVFPVVQIAIVLIYFDLRVRKEGLDLFQQAQRVTPPLPAS